MAFKTVDPKDPSAVLIHYAKFGSTLNDGSPTDRGYLQGRTLDKTAIDAATISVSPSGGVVVDSHSVVSTTITIEGITYPANTVVQITLSGGVASTDYNITIPLTLSTGEIDERTFTVPCRNL